MKTRALVAIGLISYGAYLWHQPILAFSRHLNIGTSGLGFVFSAASLILVLSFVSYRYVETPFRNRGVISSRTVWLAVAVSVSAVVLLSVTTQSNNGFKGRFAASTHEFIEDFDRNGDYVHELFRALENRKFRTDSPSQTKIVLIGDSFAMDIVNTLQAGEMLESTNLMVHHISARCGNLYLDYSIMDVIDQTDRGRCEREGWYTDSTIELIGQADEIWLSSSWQDWHLDYLEESVSNLKRDFSAKITLFGTKIFWDDNKTFSEIKKVYEDGRVVMLPKSAISTNSELDRISTVVNIRFIDIMSLLCDQSPECDIQAAEFNTLITVDGGHLTRSGALRLADRLTESIFRWE